MTSIIAMSQERLKSELSLQEARYREVKEQKLSLDMTRGKPCRAQLDLGVSLLSCLAPDDVFAEDGTDCRNYGLPFGIPEAKKLFANMIGTSENHIIIGNNSSLNIMYDTLLRSLVFGELGSKEPWITMENRKWLCPVPGYDRHFLVTQTLGFEMIPVPLLEDGPDMDIVEKLVSEDSTIKGMWCIPLYSNPDGYVYSSRVCERLASMKTAAHDFRIYWDNAYAVHHLYEDHRGTVPDILSLCDKAGNPNRVYEFASTSKVSYAGAGISCIAANPDNLAHIHKYITVQTIGPDKVNQLRHVRYIPDAETLDAVMKRQADIIRPKFEITNDILHKELSEYGIARWNKPLGGYFISLYVYPGTAKRVVALAKEAGVALTPAGATYPYSRDPKDENIRIAPTFPTIADVEKAISVLCICVKLAAAEKRLEEV